MIVLPSYVGIINHSIRILIKQPIFHGFRKGQLGWLLDRGGPWWPPTLGHCRWFDLSRGHWRNGITFAMLPLGEVSGIPSELSLERSGSHHGLVKRFFDFLCNPKNWGRIPV